MVTTHQPMSESDSARRRSLLKSINIILGHLKSFPPEFRPTEDQSIRESDSFDDSDPQFRQTVEYIFVNHFSRWPREVLSQFMALSFMIANEAALANEDHPHLDGAYLKRGKPLDAEQALAFEGLFFGTGVLRQYAMSDPTLRAKLRFANRHFSAYFPYENLIYTFLGPCAFEYLNLNSNEGRPKIQPHEASREEWINLYKIDSQVRLDLELGTLSALDHNQAKDVVVAAWGIAALMAHLSPSVFLSETAPYVSSVREKRLTVSYGKQTKVFLSLRPRSVLNALESIADLIAAEDVLDAVDLMWIAHSSLEVESVQVPYHSELVPQRPSYRVFLSHRGSDAKLDLLRKVIEHQEREEMFLDCIILSRGCVNKLFVYQSLFSSRHVFLIQTENYSSSEWCVKEQILAEYLNSKGLLVCHKFQNVKSAWNALLDDTPSVSVRINISDPAKDEVTANTNLSPGPLWFIYSDFNKEDRAPNRKTLAQYESFIACVSEAVTLVNSAIQSGNQTGESLALVIVHATRALFEQVIASGTKGESTVDLRTLKGLPSIPTDVLIVFGQIFFGLISVGTKTGNKVESRQAADKFLHLVRELVDLASHSDGCQDKQWFEYFIAMAVALALDFDREGRNDLPIQVNHHLCAKAATMKARHLLFDVRGRTVLSKFRLRIAALLVRYGIGTVAIVQSASNTLHDKSVDGFQLSVLPCVTLYPGMSDMLGLEGD